LGWIMTIIMRVMTIIMIPPRTALTLTLVYSHPVLFRITAPPTLR